MPTLTPPASPSPQSIDPGQQFTWEHSNLEVNKPKNRYANVIAYDHSRVILQPIEGIAHGGPRFQLTLPLGHGARPEWTLWGTGGETEA